MADAVRQHQNQPPELNRRWVDTGTVGQDGNPVYAELIAVDFSSSKPKQLLSVPFSLSASNNVIPAVPGIRIKVYALVLNASGVTTCAWRDGSSSLLEGTMVFADHGGYARDVDPPSFIYATSVGNGLDLVVTTGTASGSVSYWATDST